MQKPALSTSRLSRAARGAVIRGNANLGTEVRGLQVVGFDADGNRLAQAKVGPDGQYRLRLPRRFRKGQVTLKLVDINGKASNFTDSNNRRADFKSADPIVVTVNAGTSKTVYRNVDFGSGSTVPSDGNTPNNPNNTSNPPDNSSSSGGTSPAVPNKKSVAAITGTSSAALTEDGTPSSASGSLTVSDVDANQNTFKEPEPAALNGTYGNFTFNNGLWGYTLNNADPDTQALAAGVTVTDSFLVTSFDGTASQAITVSITGANDPASITGTSSAALTEDGTPSSASGSLSVSDVDSAENSFKAPAPAALNGTYGNFTFNNGLWDYTLNNADPDTQALAAGVTVTDSFLVTSFDGTASQAITVSITGANDPASITGTSSAALTEDGTPSSASGSLSVSDVDTAENTFKAPAPAALNGTYGNFTFNNGLWDYTLNNADPDTQALAAGVTVTDSFLVTSFDGTASQAITVSITGVNDPASITGTSSAALTEDGTPSSASGSLSVSDVDTAENTFKAPAPAALNGTYGNFTFNNGLWDYTLNNADPDTQALAAGVTVTDSFLVTSFDGTASQAITVSITGANDPASITGTSSAALTEDGTPSSASGSLSVSDVDTAENTFKAPAPAALNGTYGNFTFNNGLWDYTLNNADPDTQSLAAGVTVTDSFLVTSFDGTASQAITVSITGVNDPASITGTSSAALTEDGTPSSASGSLSVSDVDTAENTFKAPTPAALNGTYGNFTFNNGLWDYTLNNADPDTQALAAGVTVTDSFLVTSFDGTASQAITVSITGANDPASITGTSSAALTEDGTPSSASGSLSISDVDTAENTFKAPAPAALNGTYGNFTFNNGLWDYTLNNADPDTQALAAGVTVTDSFLVTSFDGTASQAITVSITGVNDPASITGTSSAALTETDGILSTGGSLSITDVDTIPTSFQSRSNVPGSNGLGSFNVNSTGAWTYVTNDAGAADSLSAGQTITDSFVVSSFDGSASQTISVTITGTERKLVVDSTGFVFVDTDGDGIKDNGESSATLDGTYNFADDQVTVIFTGIPTTQNKVNLSGFGSDDKVIINYAGMSNPFGLSAGQQEFANFKTLSAGWAGLIPATVATAQNNIFSLKKIVGVGQIGLNASNPNGGGALKATFSNTAGGIGFTKRTFAIWSSQTSIPLNDLNRVSITWPKVPPTAQNPG